ncbi:virulence factor MviN [Candidatus Saccharibacteria bacterium]|nr:virulence factor MviN [Candidatus Saccharibacteria bacterium]
MGRVRDAVYKVNKRLTVRLAATLLAGSMLLSGLLGFFRDRLLNSAYMPNEAAGLAGYPVGLDAYTAAFTVPDFMFAILVSGALSVTFIPVFNARWVKGNKQSAWEIGSSMINFMALVTMVVSVLIIIFANQITSLIVPGFSESAHALTASMMRVIAVNPFIFAIAAVIASIQQAVGRFTFYALAPVMYNVGIIIGIFWFTQGIKIFGWQVFDGGIMGVALGVVLGSFLQLIISSVGLIGLGFDYRFKLYWRNKGFRKVLQLLPARSVDQGMDYTVSLVELNLLSRMGAGVTRAYNQALTLHMMPINLIGVAISSAAFPQLSDRLGEGRQDMFQAQLRQVLRVIIWLALPTAVITFFTRGYIVHFIRNTGDPLMAGILGALVIAILFRTIYHMAARVFYAQQDTKTPLYISFVCISLNIILAIVLSMVLDMGAYGLAWAQSIVAVVEVTILFTVMNKRMPRLFNKEFLHAISRMLIATGIMAIVCYISVVMLPFREADNSFYSAFPRFLVIVAISFLVYGAMSKLLKLTEVDPIILRLRRVLFARFDVKS